MTDRWVKLDADFFRHPKVLKAGRDARDLYLASLCYCGRYATDGVISREALSVVASDAGIVRARAAADDLVTARLWVDHVEGWLIPDFVEENLSRDEVETRRAADRKRQRDRRARLARDRGLMSLDLSRDGSRDDARESHDQRDETRRESAVVPTTDRPEMLREAVGRSGDNSVDDYPPVAAAAAALYAGWWTDEAEPGTVRNRRRYAAATAEATLAERGPDLLTWLETHPTATAADLAHAVLDVPLHRIAR